MRVRVCVCAVTLQTLRAVSYTHLDVYKRQDLDDVITVNDPWFKLVNNKYI